MKSIDPYTFPHLNILLLGINCHKNINLSEVGNLFSNIWFKFLIIETATWLPQI